jgi:hypothetical protein
MRNYIRNFTKFTRLNENTPQKDFALPAWLPGEEDNGDMLEPFDHSMLRTTNKPILVWYDSSKYPDDEVWSSIMTLNLDRSQGVGSIKAIPCPLGTSIGSSAATRFLHTQYQP